MKYTVALAAFFLLAPIGMAVAQTPEPQATAEVPAENTGLPGGPDAKQIFNDMIKTSEAVKKYPFLKEYTQGVAGNQLWNTGSFKAGKIDFLFFHLSAEYGSDRCGALGCPMSVWANEGKKYFQVMDILNKESNIVTYVQKEDKVTLYFCDEARGLSTWQYENSHFVHKKADEQTPECNVKKMLNLDTPMPGLEGLVADPSASPAGTE